MTPSPRLRAPPPTPMAVLSGLPAAWKASPSTPLGCHDSTNVRLLITGCGRSGTHAVTGMLQQAGMHAVHEFGREQLKPANWTTALVSWQGAAYLHSAQYWRGSPCYGPVIKIHREPLGAISSLASGFNAPGNCSTEANTYWDAFSWRFASRLVELPLYNATQGYARACQLNRRERLWLALRYWVGWNVLADGVATHSMKVEAVTPGVVQDLWCSYCAQIPLHCKCPSQGIAMVEGKVTPRADHNPSSTSVHHSKPLTWAELQSIDAEATRDAALLATSYGYPAADPPEHSLQSRRVLAEEVNPMAGSKPDTPTAD